MKGSSEVLGVAVRGPRWRAAKATNEEESGRRICVVGVVVGVDDDEDDFNVRLALVGSRGLAEDSSIDAGVILDVGSSTRSKSERKKGARKALCARVFLLPFFSKL